MPASYAHYRFGREILKLLPPGEKQCISRFRRLYDAGLQGPDIFYYHNPFWKDKVVQLGARSHRTNGAEFFSEASRAAGSEAARAYLYGLLSHYCLDSVCHPLVNRLDSIGEAGHTVLEAEFDRFLLTLDGEPHPETFHLSRKLKLTRGECMTAAAFYPDASGGTVSRCVKNMAFCTRFLANPGRRPFLEKLHVADHMIPARETEELTLYVRELKDLYDAALEKYPQMLSSLTRFIEDGTALDPDFEPQFG